MLCKLKRINCFAGGGGGRANFAAIDYSLLCGFCAESVPLPFGAEYRLQYIIVLLPWPPYD